MTERLGLGPSGGLEDEKERSDSEYILKVKIVKFADGLDERSKRTFKDNSKVFGLSTKRQGCYLLRRGAEKA